MSFNNNVKSNLMNFGDENDLLAYRKYIISLLVIQAKIDNEFSIIEKKYLKYAGGQMKLNDEEIAGIRLNPSQFIIAPPPGESQRITILYYLLFMMRADQKVTIEEEELCYKVGLHLGFREEMVRNLIGVMKEYLHKQLPPYAMLNEIKPYLN